MAGVILGYSTLRVIVVYQIFIAVDDTMQKNFPFLPLKKTRHRSTSLAAPNVLTFGSFLMLSNVLKLLSDQDLMILQDQLVPYMNECLQFFVFKLFGGATSFFIFNIKIIIFEASKPIFACWFWWSIVAESLTKNSLCFSSRFLLNKVVL